MSLELAYKKNLRNDFVFLTICTFLVALIFSNSTIDLWAAKLFYHPEAASDPWYEEHFWLWKFFYFAAPWLSGLLLIVSLGVLVAAQYKDSLKAYRKYSAFVFIVVVLGSGFFINTVFKPYWGRPRPREVIELGGNSNFQTFYQPNIAGPGKSFPCGHCSVGFSYGLLAWILRRRTPRLSKTIFLGSLALGLVMGIGRMAAGGHFLSDVAFAGLIIYWTSYFTYYFILRIPQLENQSKKHPELAGLIFAKTAKPQRSHLLTNISYLALGLITVGVLLLATPYHYDYALTGNLIEHPKAKIDELHINIDTGQVEILISDAIKTSFRIDGVAQGFGFPGSKLLPTCNFEAPQKTCEVSKSGFFSDLESKVIITLRPELIEQLTVTVREGDFFIKDHSQLPSKYKFLNRKKDPAQNF